MNSLVLKTATKFLLALMLLFSIFILFRGHNEPGGGFIAGLITASAFALYIMTHGPIAARRLIFIDPHYCIALGVSCTIISGLISLFEHKPFLTGLWYSVKIANTNIYIGTPVIFDIGVYITVVSSITLILFALEEK